MAKKKKIRKGLVNFIEKTVAITLSDDVLTRFGSM
jgi:hypothetical protein